MPFSPAGEKVAVRPDEGAFPCDSTTQIENLKSAPLTLALSPKGARGQSQNVLLPRGGEGGR